MSKMFFATLLSSKFIKRVGLNCLAGQFWPPGPVFGTRLLIHWQTTIEFDFFIYIPSFRADHLQGGRLKKGVHFCVCFCFMRGTMTGRKVIKTDVSTQHVLLVRLCNQGIRYWYQRTPGSWAPGKVCKTHLNLLMEKKKQEKRWMAN